MTQRKPYNPNTAYGRKKLREQSKRYYDELPQDEKDDFDLMKIFIILAIVIVAFLIGYFTNNMKGALKWLSH